MNKCKFKPNQHVVAVVNGYGVTQGNVYLVNTPYTNASDIPCVSVIGDNGNLAYNYQTVFREAKMPSCLEQSVVAWEDAMIVFYEIMCDYISGFDSNHFIAKIQNDKELQKALLVLIGEGK
jgi:hypothetical protein